VTEFTIPGPHCAVHKATCNAHAGAAATGPHLGGIALGPSRGQITRSTSARTRLPALRRHIPQRLQPAKLAFSLQFCFARSRIRIQMRIQLKRLGLVTASLLLACALLWFVPRALVEPAYNRHPLSYWFNELPPYIPMADSRAPDFRGRTIRGRTYGPQREAADATQKAIRSIGKRGLPFIMAKLCRKDRPLVDKVEQLAFRYIRRSIFPDVEAQRWQSVNALVLLCPLPLETVAELRKSSKSSDQRVAIAAGMVLRAGTNGWMNAYIESNP